MESRTCVLRDSKESTQIKMAFELVSSKRRNQKMRAYEQQNGYNLDRHAVDLQPHCLAIRLSVYVA
jgi:hypothetical protein